MSGKNEPWDPTLNPSYSFTNGGATAPIVLTSGIDFTPGNTVTIQYLFGMDETNVDFCCVDGLGYNTPQFETDSNFPNGAPADGMSTTPVYLQELLGTFTDSLGQIVGTPFVVGDGTSVIVPVGATQLQLGINDNYFPDNGDDPNGPPLTFSVTSNGTVESVPEPGTFALVGGAALLGLAVSRRKRVSA